MAKIDDSLNVTINIRWLVQLVAIIGAMVTAWFTLQSDITELKMNYEAIDKRLMVIENSRNAELEEINKSLLQKMFKKEK
jgi:NH3-dependent NAD+ synthetase